MIAEAAGRDHYGHDHPRFGQAVRYDGAEILAAHDSAFGIREHAW
jgi:hypothetical protein